MEKTIGLRAFRENIGKYARATARGTSFVVMRKNEPLFRIASVDDEEGWETIIDFTKIKRGGVDIKEILARL